MPFIPFYVAPHKHPGLQVASLFCTLNLTQLHGPDPHPKLLKLFPGSSGNSPSSAKPPSIPSLFSGRTLRTELPEALSRGSHSPSHRPQALGLSPSSLSASSNLRSSSEITHSSCCNHLPAPGHCRL